MDKYGKERSQKVIDFLEEIINLSKKYDLFLSHEDDQGGFEVYHGIDEYHFDWLRSASEFVNDKEKKDV